MLRMTDVVKNLLIINVLFFLCTYIIFDQQMMLDFLALHYPESDLFKPLQIVTHFFMHGGLAHIFFNMFALVMFGAALETMWGAQRFLFFYLVCAVGAAALHTLYNWYDFSQTAELIQQFDSTGSATYFQQFIEQTSLSGLQMKNGLSGEAYARELLGAIQNEGGAELTAQASRFMNDTYQLYINTPVVGASGAIYGLLLAFGMYFPNTELMLIFLPIPIKAKYFIPVLMLAELFLGVNQFSWDNIAHFAHLGGAVTGFLLILYWRKFGSRY